MILSTTLILDLMQMWPTCLLVLHGIRLDHGTENLQSPVLRLEGGLYSDAGRLFF